MKKRIYFITASIISFLLSIYSIMIANETVKETINQLKEMYSGFPQDFQNRVIGIYETAGVKMTIFFGIIVIIASLLLFVFAKNNTLLKHKGLVIALSVLSFVFTDRILVQLLAIASFIIILCCKRKNPEDFPDKKRIPKLELEKVTKKDIVFGILLTLLYFSQFIWVDYLPNNFKLKLITSIAFYVIMIILSILVFRKQLKNNFISFKNNINAYIKFILPRFGMAYVFLFVFSMISVVITKKAVSTNQETVESLPLYFMIPAAVIYAPIVEELIFRGVFRRIIKNKILFIIISAISFGILHTIEEGSVANILVMSLPYASLGAYLAYIYTRTNNLCSNILSHALFNSISALFMIFI